VALSLEIPNDSLHWGFLMRLLAGKKWLCFFFVKIRFYFLKFISIFAAQNLEDKKSGYTHGMVEKSPACLPKQVFFSFGLSGMRLSAKYYCSFRGRYREKHSTVSCYASDSFVFDFYRPAYQIRFQARRFYY
jgi:hypothetical protein